jgi:hypothetical protein
MLDNEHNVFLNIHEKVFYRLDDYTLCMSYFALLR